METVSQEEDEVVTADGLSGEGVPPGRRERSQAPVDRVQNGRVGPTSQEKDGQSK